MTLTVEQQYLLGPEIIRIPAHTDEHGNHYNLVSDIVVVLGVGPYLFKVGSVIVPILQDDQGGWHTPLRLDYIPDIPISLFRVDPNHPVSKLRTILESDDDPPQKPFYRTERHILHNLIAEQTRVNAFLATQNFELHEFQGPRHFVVLPASFKEVNPQVYEMDDLRLYFLCEWGEDFCVPDGRHVRPGGSIFQQLGLPPVGFPIPFKRRVHLHYHEGYRLTRPKELFDKYGRYLLGMLRVLRHCLVLSVDVEPTLVALEPNWQVPQAGIEFESNNAMAAVDLMTVFLAQRINLETQPLPPSSIAPPQQQQPKGDGELPGQTFKFFIPLDNSEIRRLDTYIQIKNRNKILAGLHKIVTKPGHVKWICWDHYEGIYPPETQTTFFRSLLALVANQGAILDHFRDKVRIDLTSNINAQDFFARYAHHSPTIGELDVKLHGKPESADFAGIVQKIAQSDIRVLKLELNDIWMVGSLTGFSFGKGRYHPLMSLFMNPKLKALRFYNLCKFGLRTSKFSSSQKPFVHLQSLHFLSLISLPDGNRLSEVLNLCPNLVDLRLGTRIKFRSEQCPKLDAAVRNLKKLESFHLYMYKSAPEEELRGRVKSEPYTGKSLKELVSITNLSGLYALQDYICRSTTTIEALIFENYHRKDFVLDLTPMTLDHHASLLFAKLSHLDLQTAISPESMQLLSILLPNMQLFHLGLGPHVKALLGFVNFESIKSLYLVQMTELHLKPLFIAAISKTTPPTPFQLQSLRLDRISQIQHLPNLLKAVSLRYLYLEGLGARALSLVLTSVNLTELRDIIIDDIEYEWPVEAVLAKRHKEFDEDLQIHLTTVERRQIHLMSDEGGRRSVIGSEDMLSEKVLDVVPNMILNHFYLSSLLLNNF
ncbi:hypothetical protein BGZ47_007055 [Haplosporangium gracile]|nr:hypothetical protein BGZ47_007055 [Haplosporangium gracile]